jgi:hypothetical protein
MSVAVTARKAVTVAWAAAERESVLRFLLRAGFTPCTACGPIVIKRKKRRGRKNLDERTNSGEDLPNCVGVV